MGENHPEGKMREIGELAEKLAQSLSTVEKAEERVAAALTALSILLGKSGLTLAEQAALLKLLDVLFHWQVKEAYQRAQTPIGVT